jgi:glycosyltransferase involved in cell wall biosynthesis
MISQQQTKSIPKVAIVSDWLVTIGGAEKVLGQMLECFPQADLFALIDFLPPSRRDFIKNKTVTTTFIQKLPFARSNYRIYLPLMPLAIEQLNLSHYDLIITSSHAVAKGVLTGPNQLHICYCHSPIRYAWDLQHQYLRESDMHRGIISLIIRSVLHKIRMWDISASNSVDYFIANSKFVAKRINKFYRRSSDVIYPPVSIDVGLVTPREDYYVTASRLVSYKRVDLIVEAFTLMPDRNLVVIGEGVALKKILRIAKGHTNIKVIGYQKDAVLHDYLSRARAFIFMAEEDFGIIPIEAQAHGTPVIAYGRGGALETIIGDGKEQELTGKFFLEQTVWSLMVAINQFEQMKPISANVCINNAKRFEQIRFRNEFTRFVLDKYQQFKNNSI